MGAAALGSSSFAMIRAGEAPSAVLMESYISYLGYGVQPPLASWGNMLTNAQGYLDTVPWLAILPGAAITLTVMGFNFLGDGLRDALDPRLRMDR
ncbi:MAG: ABC transporter permease subunit [Acetobacteraceae bacterium]|nr:MAG: ABC transporter permease subunit [Acetobacteraceae bacterium]